MARFTTYNKGIIKMKRFKFLLVKNPALTLANVDPRFVSIVSTSENAARKALNCKEKAVFLSVSTL